MRFNVSDFERQAQAIGGALDQVPYALALALNTAAENTRQLLIQEWPSRVRVRQEGFIRYALRREFATKHNLRVVIFDQTGKPFMQRLDTGGVHLPRGANLAIPSGNVRVGTHGVVKSQRPRALQNSFVKNGAIYIRSGRKGRRIKLMYLLRPSANVPKKTSFHEDFAISMRNECRTSFPSAMARAMKTRR